MIKNIINAIFLMGLTQILGDFVYSVSFYKSNLNTIYAFLYLIILLLIALPGIMFISNKAFSDSSKSKILTIFCAGLMTLLSQYTSTNSGPQWGLGFQLGCSLCAISYWQHLLRSAVDFRSFGNRSAFRKSALIFCILIYLSFTAFLVTDFLVRVF